MCMAVLAAGLFFGGLYLLYLFLRMIFMRSLLLGLLFLFFALPLIGRLIFFLFIAVFPFLVAGILGMSNGKENTDKEDDVIDVKYKIIK